MLSMVKGGGARKLLTEGCCGGFLMQVLAALDYRARWRCFVWDAWR